MHAIARQPGPEVGAPKAGGPVIELFDRWDGSTTPVAQTRSSWVAGPGRTVGAVVLVASRSGMTLLATAVTFQQIDRVLRVFRETSPPPAFLPARGCRRVRAVLGRVLPTTVLAARPPGADLDLPPPADLPAELVCVAAWSAQVAARVAVGTFAASGRSGRG